MIYRGYTIEINIYFNVRVGYDLLNQIVCKISNCPDKCLSFGCVRYGDDNDVIDLIDDTFDKVKQHIDEKLKTVVVNKDLLEKLTKLGFKDGE